MKPNSKIECDSLHREGGLSHKAYTANGEINIPDLYIRENNSTYTYEPLRGNAYVMAVFNENNNCIGFISSDDLGYETVKDYMEANNLTGVL